MMFQDKLQELAAANVLTVEGWRVLVMVVSKVDFENFIHVKQVQIAEELGMKPPNVNKAFKRLIELGILEKISQDNFNGYRLNYEMGWKGKASNLKTHIKKKKRAEAIQMAAHAKKMAQIKSTD
ncbi:winged helix-turn-helix transcriptional regulator [Chromatium okenii]|nr:winged helix-turn-helix transcriptional regulator [Chromatium okenii]MBV5311388.1 winged helix-turn-helix transcriptional regulator [Chromatium okenii]